MTFDVFDKKMLTSYGKSRNSALASALDSPRRGSSSGIGSAALKRKERSGNDDERARQHGEGGGTPDRRPAPGHPDGTPPGVVVAKVVERGVRAEAVRARSTAAKAISEANQARDHGGLVDPTALLVPEEKESNLASASKQLFGEDEEEDAGVTPGAGTKGDEGSWGLTTPVTSTDVIDPQLRARRLLDKQTEVPVSQRLSLRGPRTHRLPSRSFHANRRASLPGISIQGLS